MIDKDSKLKSGNLFPDLKLQIFSRNSDFDNHNKYSSAKTAESSHIIFNRNKYISPFKYNKLYFYEKEDNFSKELKKKQMKRKKINLKKINNFHQMLMHDKIKSFTDTKDYSDLTNHNRTIDVPKFIPTNLSINFNNQHYLTKSENFNIYNGEIENMKNNNKILLLIKNITLDKSSEQSINQNTISKGDEISNCTSLKKKAINDKKTINYNQIKNQKALTNYKFKDVFGNPNDNLYIKGNLCSYRYDNTVLSEQIKNKLKLNIVNKVQKDYFQIQSEKIQNPISVISHCELFNETNKNYFLLFENLLKKYLGYLYSNIEKEKYQLYLLIEQKENLKKEILILIKQINSEKEKKNFFQNLIKLLIKIRYNVDSLDKIPKEYLKKYGIMKAGNNIKKTNKYTIKRNSMLITELKDNSYMKYLTKSSQDYVNQNNLKFKKIRIRKGSIPINDDFNIRRNHTLKSKSPKKRIKEEFVIIPKIPIFNGVNELDAKIRGIEYNLKELYKEVNNKNDINKGLKIELNKLNSEYIFDDDIKISNSFIKMEKKEAKKQKEKYDYYSKFKKDLISFKDNYIESKPQRKEIMDTNNFSSKLISILLKLDINIEFLLKKQGIYKFLNSQEDTKIIYNSKEYNKTMFCVKILETIFLNLINEKRKFLSDDSTREKYLELQEIIDKKNRVKKLEEKKMEDDQKRYLKEKSVLLKFNKLIILPKKKDDPFYFNSRRNNTIETAKKNNAKAVKNERFKLSIENELLF